MMVKEHVQQNLICSLLSSGVHSLFVGIIFFLISGASVSYIDSNGFLHENFFLIPLGYLSLFVGIVIIIARIINSIRLAIKERKNN